MLQRAAVKNNIGFLNRKSAFKTIMCRLACKGDKVLRSVIMFDFIEMVNGFLCPPEKSFQKRFNDEPMLKDVSPSPAIGMVRNQDSNISPVLMPNSPVPFSIISPPVLTQCGPTHLLPGFLRSALSIIKVSRTGRILFPHCFAPLRKTLFSTGVSHFVHTLNGIMSAIFPKFFKGFRRMMRTFYHVFSPRHIIQIINGGVNYMFEMKKV